jgi:anti-sigma factor RsiW
MRVTVNGWVRVLDGDGAVALGIGHGGVFGSVLARLEQVEQVHKVGPEDHAWVKAIIYYFF